MAAETTVSRLGLKQGSSPADNLELFLKKFAGEVLTTFETENVFKPLHLIRTIENGKSAQFPVTGTATAKYHSPGDNMLLAANSYINQIAHSERVIHIDGLLTSSTFISKIDEAMNHYDVRSIYTTELGRALAKKFDNTIARVVIKAARASANLTGGKGDQFVDVTGAGSTTITGAKLADAIYAAAQKLDEADVPSEERYAVLSPANYYLLVQEVAKYTNANAIGSYVDGSVVRVGGVQIVKSNNLPSTNISSAEGNNGGYTGDFSGTVGVVFHKNAVGTVKLLDLAVESEYKIELQGTFMVAKYAMGHGILRPECAVELTSTDTQQAS